MTDKYKIGDRFRSDKLGQLVITSTDGLPNPRWGVEGEGKLHYVSSSYLDKCIRLTHAHVDIAAIREVIDSLQAWGAGPDWTGASPRKMRRWANRLTEALGD
jgi:hypothetical protein